MPTPRKTRAAAAVAEAEGDANAEVHDSVDDAELDRLVSQACAEVTSRLKKAPTAVQQSGGLLSALDAGVDTSNLYIKFAEGEVANGSLSSAGASAMELEVQRAMNALGNLEKMDVVPSQRVTAQNLARKKKREEANDHAGKGWYNLPATPLTPELKRDLQLLRMRNVLDRKRHYKANDSKALPKYFQVGRIIEGAGEFYSSRLPKAQRKQTLVDELLSDAKLKRYAKKKFVEVEKKHASGRKAHYKAVKDKRKPAFAK